MAARHSRKIDEENFRGDAIVEEIQDEEIDHQPSSRNYTVTESSTKEARSMTTIDPTEWDLEDSQEPYALKDGTEAKLRIIEVRFDVRADDSKYYTVRFEVPSEPYSKDITDWLNVPDNGLDAKRLNAAKQKMWHFMDCFAIDRTKLCDPVEDWPGQEGWCLLGLTKSAQYGEQNRIAKFIRPR